MLKTRKVICKMKRFANIFLSSFATRYLYRNPWRVHNPAVGLYKHPYSSTLIFILDTVMGASGLPSRFQPLAKGKKCIERNSLIEKKYITENGKKNISEAFALIKDFDSFWNIFVYKLTITNSMRNAWLLSCKCNKCNCYDKNNQPTYAVCT